MSFFPLACLFIWHIPGSHEFITEYWTLNYTFYFAKYMSNIENEILKFFQFIQYQNHERASWHTGCRGYFHLAVAQIFKAY